jgi:hypothetical protein
MVLRRVEVHRPFCGHPHWFSEAVGQIQFGGERFFSVLEPGDGGPLRHALRLSTDPARVPQSAGLGLHAARFQSTCRATRWGQP